MGWAVRRYLLLKWNILLSLVAGVVGLLEVEVVRGGLGQELDWLSIRGQYIR